MNAAGRYKSSCYSIKEGEEQQHPAWPRECEIEELILTKGGERRTRQIKQALASGQADKLQPSRRLTATLMPPLIEHLKHFTSHKGVNGVDMTTRSILARLDPEKVAMETCMALADAIFSDQSIISTALRISKQLMVEERMALFMALKPGLFRHIRKDQKEKGSTEAHVERQMVNRFNEYLGDEWEAWTRKDQERVGIKCMQLLCTSSGGMFKMQSKEWKPGDKQGKHRPYVMRARPDVEAWAIEMLKKEVFTFPQWLPMVMPPKEFESTSGTGYRTEFVPKGRMVHHAAIVSPKQHRQALADMDKVDMPLVYQAINFVAQSSWRVNHKVLEIVEWAWEKDNRVGGLPRQSEIPLPFRPEGLEKDQFAMKKWKRAAAEVHALNNKRGKLTKRTRETLSMARLMKHDEQIYFPHSYDFRGRIYPLPRSMQPQGDDLERGLLELGVAKPLGAMGLWWLKVWVANCWDVKGSFEERVQFTEKVMPTILEIGRNPRANQEWALDDVDMKWQLLAACMELQSAMDSGNPEAFPSRLCCQVDGTCNGIQHLAAMSLDERIGPLVNMLPGNRPMDLYGHVSQEVTNTLNEIINTPEHEPTSRYYAKHFIQACGDDDALPRSFAKQPVLILPYGGTLDGYMKAINKWLEANHKDLLPGDAKRKYRALLWIAQRTMAATKVALPNQVEIMEFIKECVKVVVKAGHMMEWKTPAGLLVRQLYTVQTERRVKATIGGKQVKLVVKEPGDKKIDTRLHAARIAANFTHSMDGATQMFAIDEFIKRGGTHFMAVHDSFGTHCCDMGQLNVALRDGFLKCYEHYDPLAMFRLDCVRLLGDDKAAIAQLPARPELGKLDITQVRGARYFFH